MSTDRKKSNPKDAMGTAKVPFSTVSVQVIAEVARLLGRDPSPRVVAEFGLAMMEGALKYGRHNYRVAGVRASVYFDAYFRHRGALALGQTIDPESGLHHLVKAGAGLSVLRDSMLQGNWVDDRPPKARSILVTCLGSWWEGQDVDPDTGFCPVVIELADVVCRLEALHTEDQEWVQKLNVKAAELLKRYPEDVRKAAFTEVGLRMIPEHDVRAKTWRVCPKCSWRNFDLFAMSCEECGGDL